MSTGINDAILSVHPPEGSVRIVLTCGRVLLVAPLTKRTLSIALVAPTHLIVAAIGSRLRGASFICSFSSTTEALQCTATVAHYLKASIVQGPCQIRKKVNPEQLLLESTASDPEKVGLEWWSDFSELVDVLEASYSSYRREGSARNEINIRS